MSVEGEWIQVKNKGESVQHRSPNQSYSPVKKSKNRRDRNYRSRRKDNHKSSEGRLHSRNSVDSLNEKELLFVNRNTWLNHLQKSWEKKHKKKNVQVQVEHEYEDEDYEPTFKVPSGKTVGNLKNFIQPLTDYEMNRQIIPVHRESPMCIRPPPSEFTEQDHEDFWWLSQYYSLDYWSDHYDYESSDSDSDSDSDYNSDGDYY